MEIERETRGNDSWRANAQEESKKLEDSDRPIKVTCLPASMCISFFFRRTSMYHFNLEFLEYNGWVGVLK